MNEIPPFLCYYQALRDLDRGGAIALVERYLADGGDVEGLYDDVMMRALDHTGREWQQGRISVAHEHYISAVTRDLIRRYGPRLWENIPADGPVAVVVGVPGERHTIGLMMIGDMLRSGGLTVHALGDGLSSEGIVDIAAEVGTDLICLSCALDVRLPDLADLIPRVRHARPGIRVAVGGAAIRSGGGALGLRLGADFAADDVGETRRLLRGWIADIGPTTAARASAPVPLGGGAPGGDRTGMDPVPVARHAGTRPKAPSELQSPVLRASGAAIAEVCMTRIHATWPELRDRYGERGRHLTAEDNHWHLNFLDTAAALGDPERFDRYADWLVALLGPRGMGPHHVAGAFGFLAEGLAAVEVPPEHEGHRRALIDMLQRARARVQSGDFAAEAGASSPSGR